MRRGPGAGRWLPTHGQPCPVAWHRQHVPWLRLDVQPVGTPCLHRARLQEHNAGPGAARFPTPPCTTNPAPRVLPCPKQPHSPHARRRCLGSPRALELNKVLAVTWCLLLAKAEGRKRTRVLAPRLCSGCMPLSREAGR